jgi:diacylglycerol kinase (ATP)
MRALLIYNPSSGNNRARRQHQVAAVEAAFDAAGNQTDILATTGPGSAPQQVREHCARTPIDAVIACGGDGTMNEVLQAMVADRIPASLGIVPLGTGNVVGNDLGLARNPEHAARQLLAATPTRVAVGQISYVDRQQQSASRYFLALAGAGGDALLMYRTAAAGFKQRGGMAAYYAAMINIGFFAPFGRFECSYEDESGARQTRNVIQAAGVRITNFGGLMRRWAPGAALKHDYFRLVMFTTRSRIRFVAYSAFRICGLSANVPGIHIVNTRNFTMRALEPQLHRIYVECDGELLGTLPTEVSIIPDAVTLLVPSA